MTINLLTEGGVAGHLDHLYDDSELTFSQLKDIVSSLASGKIKGTEKTDGQNLFITFDLATDKAKGARNKTEIKQGGLDSQGLSDKFAGRGELEFSFSDALKAFEEVVKKFSPEEKQQIFGSNTYYNCEILDPRVPNVIKYDIKTILVHRTGGAGNSNVEAFEKALGRVQGSKSGSYKVQIDPIRSLEPLNDKALIGNIAKRIDAITKQYDLTDESAIGDFVIARLDKIVGDKVNISNDLKIKLIKKLVGSKEVSLPDLKREIKSLPSNEASILLSLIKHDNYILSVAIKPIEELVRNFSIKVLENFDSQYITDDDEETKRIQKFVDDTISSIKSFGEKSKTDSLSKQMERLKSTSNITTATEGFVFSYNGKQYKLTGNFSPVNQIVGLVKYGDKKPAQNIEESLMLGASNTPQKVALFPGSFKPPHRGHLQVVKQLCEQYDKVIVFVSDPRVAKNTRMNLSGQEAARLMNLYIEDAGLSSKASARVSNHPSSTVSALAYVENAILETKTNFYLTTSSKNPDRFTEILSSGKLRKNFMVESVEAVVIPAISGPMGEISAKQIREIINNPFLTEEQKELQLNHYLPESIKEETKKATIRILMSWNSPSKVEEDDIQEMSVSSAVGGFPGPAFVASPRRTLRR